MFLRKICVGYYDGRSVYYDRLKKEAVIDKKETVGHHKAWSRQKFILKSIGIADLVMLVSLFVTVPISKSFSGIWTVETLIYIAVITAFVSLPLSYFGHLFINGSSSNTELATEEAFMTAILTNKIWEGIGSVRKITRGDFVIYNTVNIILLLTIFIFPFMLHTNLGNKMGSEAVGLFFSIPVMPAAGWIVVVENNPNVLLGVIRKYQLKKLKIRFKAEEESGIKNTDYSILEGEARLD